MRRYWPWIVFPYALAALVLLVTCSAPGPEFTGLMPPPGAPAVGYENAHVAGGFSETSPTASYSPYRSVKHGSLSVSDDVNIGKGTIYVTGNAEFTGTGVVNYASWCSECGVRCSPWVSYTDGDRDYCEQCWEDR